MSGGSYDYPKKSLANLVMQMFSPGSWSGDFSALPLALSVPPPRPWAHRSTLLFSHPYNSPSNMSVILRPVPWTSGIVFGKHARGGRYSVQARYFWVSFFTVIFQESQNNRAPTPRYPFVCLFVFYNIFFSTFGACLRTKTSFFFFLFFFSASMREVKKRGTMEKKVGVSLLQCFRVLDLFLLVLAALWCREGAGNKQTNVCLQRVMTIEIIFSA